MYFPHDKWATISPEAAGIPGKALENLLARVEHEDMRMCGLILLHEGHMVLEHYWNPKYKEQPKSVASVTKSVVSILAGIAISEGLLDEDAAVISFFPEAFSKLFGNGRRKSYAALRVKHLLSMTSGRKNDSSWNRKNAVGGFFKPPLANAPGSHFAYLNGDFNMVAAILQRVTGKDLLEYANEKLFIPLGIEKPQWSSTLNGVRTGCGGLRLKTRDVARIGLLLLAGGVWDGVQTVPKDYLKRASSEQWTFPDGNRHLGYGYGFWLSALPSGMYYGVGLGGHYCIVLPRHGLICAAIAHGDMHKLPYALEEEVVQAMWDKSN